MVTQPKLDSDAFNRSQMSAIEERHGQLVGILEERRSFLSFIRSNSSALQSFYSETLGTRRERLTTILANREEISNQFGIVPTQVRYDLAGVQGRPLEQFKMSFPLTGSYESLRFFIDTLETSDDFLIINDIELNSREDNEGLTNMNMRIQVSTLFFDPQRNQNDADGLEVDDE